MANIIKKVAQKLVMLVADHCDSIKTVIDNQRGIQAALKRTEDFEVDEVQITSWILDEAVKAQQRVHGFDIEIGTYADLRENLPRTIEATKAYLMKKVGLLGHIGFVKTKVDKLAKSTAVSTVNSMVGQTNWVEKGDPTDSVMMYPSQLRGSWWSLAIHGEGIEDIVRQMVRHEFRHAEQIQALRKIGGSDLVKKVVELDETLPYNKRITEMDAWNEQHLPSYRPIDEFVKEALAAVAAH